jgi:hypothetical protein
MVFLWKYNAAKITFAQAKVTYTRSCRYTNLLIASHHFKSYTLESLYVFSVWWKRNFCVKKRKEYETSLNKWIFLGEGTCVSDIHAYDYFPSLRITITIFKFVLNIAFDKIFSFVSNRNYFWCSLTYNQYVSLVISYNVKKNSCQFITYINLKLSLCYNLSSYCIINMMFNHDRQLFKVHFLKIRFLWKRMPLYQSFMSNKFRPFLEWYTGT